MVSPSFGKINTFLGSDDVMIKRLYYCTRNKLDFCYLIAAYSIFDDSIFQDEHDGYIQLSNGSKYEVVVQKSKDETTVIWSGVIISKKFVLSVDVYDREKE